MVVVSIADIFETLDASIKEEVLGELEGFSKEEMAFHNTGG